jgi:hypothetical protein
MPEQQTTRVLLAVRSISTAHPSTIMGDWRT